VHHGLVRQFCRHGNACSSCSPWRRDCAASATGSCHLQGAYTLILSPHTRAAYSHYQPVCLTSPTRPAISITPIAATQKIRSLMEIGVDMKHEAAAAQKGARNLLAGRGEECNDPETIRCFYECVAQNMNAEQCIAYIKDTIGEDLDCHEIPELKIVVNTPHTADVISATYWMFGIPVNIYGEVDCDIDGGIITYPWDWVAGGGTAYIIPPVPCIGLDTDECCTTVLDTVSAAGIPLVDDNGNCFSCWVHQEPLEPIISEGTGELAYIEHAQGVIGTCEAVELTPIQVVDADTAAEDAIATSVTAIEAILDAGSVTCSHFIDLQLELL
jgi:hypothetical protein